MKPYGILLEPVRTVPSRKLASNYGSHGPVHVSYRYGSLDPLAPLNRRAAYIRQDGFIKGVLYSVILFDLTVGSPVLGNFGTEEDTAQIYALGLPVVKRLSHLEAVRSAYHLVYRPKTHFCHYLAKLSGDKMHEIDHVRRISRVFLAKRGVLRRNSYRTGIKMTDPHHYASENY